MERSGLAGDRESVDERFAHSVDEWNLHGVRKLFQAAGVQGVRRDHDLDALPVELRQPLDNSFRDVVSPPWNKRVVEIRDDGRDSAGLERVGRDVDDSRDNQLGCVRLPAQQSVDS